MSFFNIFQVHLSDFDRYRYRCFNTLTVPFSGLLLGCLLALAVPLPFILIRYGSRIRASSQYAASPELEVQQHTSRAPGNTAITQDPVLGAKRARNLSPFVNSSAQPNA